MSDVGMKVVGLSVAAVRVGARVAPGRLGAEDVGLSVEAGVDDGAGAGVGLNAKSPTLTSKYNSHGLKGNWSTNEMLYLGVAVLGVGVLGTAVLHTQAARSKQDW